MVRLGTRSESLCLISGIAKACLTSEQTARTGAKAGHLCDSCGSYRKGHVSLRIKFGILIYTSLGG